MSILIFLMLLMPVSVDALYFEDNTPDKWFYDSINYITVRGWTAGFNDGLYHPNDTITKAQAITMLSRSIGFVSEDKTFDNWYDPYVEFALDNNFINDSENLDAPTTRYELGKIIISFLDLELKDVKEIYKDINDEITTTLYENEIMMGINTEDGLIFNENGYITRAQIATILTSIDKNKNVNLFLNENNIYLDDLQYFLKKPIIADEYSSFEEATTNALLYLVLSGEKEVSVKSTKAHKFTDGDREIIWNTANQLYSTFPELFGVYGTKYLSIYEKPNNIELRFSIKEKFDEDLLSANNTRNKMLINSILLLEKIKKANSNFDELVNVEKAKILLDYIVQNFEYDYNRDIKSNYPQKGFEDGVFVCEGYATLYSLLLKLINIESYVIRGYTPTGYHAWVIANIDGEYKMTDPTFADGYKMVNGKKESFIDYKYFNKTWNEFLEIGNHVSYNEPNIILFKTLY